MPEHFTTGEVEEMKRLANEKYDTRIEQYQRGEKQWDTNVSIIMVIRGTKKSSSGTINVFSAFFSQ